MSIPGAISKASIEAAYAKANAIATCHRHFESLQPAIRLHLPETKLKPQLPKRVKRPIEWFPPEEVKAILQAFKTDRFSSPFAPVPHSYYYPYVCFLAYTGCRPEEAISLLWSDLFWPQASCEASITKVFSKNILKPYTKNHLIRNIPISLALQDLLEERKRRSGLVFPSPHKKHIDQSNFSSRVWNCVLHSLVAEGEIRKRLRPYCLRHSFVTNIHHEHGVPFPTIAHLIGDKIETVIRFYSGTKPLTTQTFPNLY
ncbi:MAG: tyrosine-type recombinase/integrase [Roseofilum sp. SBFL]|uniref:tyrosine-type recombinase/integrase n=1 Tax=unclassified Roseofilum TaxID=2620099 RepID=UPI001AFD2FCC|nr:MULTISPECIES: tyrosine-type recombinase/integrase [unclassified Roseofilum]MBP0012924.1 tyrosine-type recombinase/integrase [Roseofilum sp. SID3]MBP0022764.1 tyrosine-type recombinase/integrase [Roseofilum sp. SID2]MBP0038830.1 tyrosine-type recombinase/integrase [Roseofilum sp. SID1]MBP0043895.1 tyrosine-type recombinase/integrase [Roseofilum sp. SBFL]